MKTISYEIDGLDCANCAKSLESYLNKCQKEGIDSVNLNFLTKTLKVNYQNKELSIDELLKIIKKGTDDPIKLTYKKDNTDYHVKVFDKEVITLIIRILISTLLLIIGFTVFNLLSKETFDVFWWCMLSFYIISYLIISYDYLFKFIKSFTHPKTMINEITLMTIASIGAFAIQEFPESVLVMVLAQVGEVFEHISVNKSRNIIVNTIDMRPKVVSKINNGKIEVVGVETLNINDEIVLKVGEVLPVDGVVVSGNALIDTSSVTGEFEPVLVTKNNNVMSGTTIVDGTINISVKKEFKDSTTAQILKMVIDSGEHKSRAENFISKFAKIYTPIVFALALIIGVFVPLIVSLVNGNWSWDNTWYHYIYIGLTFLVISCPCAIVISVPLAYFIGVALASKRGIMIKGSNYLDRLNDVKELVTDKTGTLTTGKFSIQEKKFDIDEKTFDEYVSVLESHSTHPIAKAIVSGLNYKDNYETLDNYHDLSGYGVSGIYKGHELLFGNYKLLAKHSINFAKIEDYRNILYLVVDKICVGYIIVDDTIKENSKALINYLNIHKIKTLMLTGGNNKSADAISKKLGINNYYSNLLPEDKINHLKEELKQSSSHYAVAYVGDGINDAPSIILSDVGIAMGGLGSDASVTNADVVLMNDDPLKIAEAISIAKATRTQAIFNIVFALVVKITIMILSLLSLVPMWVAVIADTGLSLFLILCSILLLKKKIKVK